MLAPFTLPAPGDAGLGGLRTRYLRRSARLLLDWPHVLPGWLAHAWGGVREPLGAILARDPAAFYAALLLPQVGAPLHAGRLEHAIPALLTELARRRVVGTAGVWWHGPVSRLVSPPTGLVLDLPAARAGMVFHDGAVEVAPGELWPLGPGGADGTPTAPARTAFHALAEGGWFAEVDTNPLASVEAHPDKAGNAVDLGTATVADWLRAIDEARALVREALPALAAEHRSLLATVVPVGGPMEQSLSASYQEAIGLAYVSLHPSPLKMAEALVHETQHNKMNLVSHVDPVLEDGGAALHVSPVRPDPRPLWGVLLAVHAFLPVAELFRTLAAGGHVLSRTATFAERFREVLQVNHDGMDVVRAHARPTAFGRTIVDGMDALERVQWARGTGP